MNNKTVLEKANAAVAEGDHETFLMYCTENTKWTFVGDRILSSKEEIRLYMADVYKKPPKFNVEIMVAEGDYVTVTGTISLFSEDGRWKEYDYCDIWRFEEGKMAELKAFVIKNNS
ncbi:ketosteroid isomerase-like protein [Chryseobacterium sp. H1D6B]|uniref:nuclear transport factor 2 family protein n=1 Tax=Chryseobacterium sp. H1D6B TaxID=2940588 RepID=UPI0015C6FB63|nr:nuclear transport factor 2 family protein [Chryseobacterium sp. H1D6B]MDH6254145.1 ketosteroid isomerase-like protein [Chryseobacterium sp. H1D6B]